MSSLSEFQIIKKIGDGTYSTVYHVRRISDRLEYALKKVKLKNLSEKELKNSINEVRILASIHDPNVISYKNAFYDKKSQCLCIVMEYANNGDLLSKINELIKTKSTFNEDEIWRIIVQVIKGLNCLHNLNILHRDMKSANVFLNNDLTAKLGDLNVSKITPKGLGYTQTGTPYYASPEVWKDQPYDKKSDIWSLGCVIYEMITLHPPFRANDMKELFQTVLTGKYEDIPLRYSRDLSKLIRSMLSVSPFLRPTCDQILDKDYVKFYAKKVGIKLERDNDIKDVLMQTIQIPTNFHNLGEKLPKPNYSTEIIESTNTIPNNINILKKNNFSKRIFQVINESEIGPLLPNINQKKLSIDTNISKNPKILAARNLEKNKIDIKNRLSKNKSMVICNIPFSPPRLPKIKGSRIVDQKNIIDQLFLHEKFLENQDATYKSKNPVYNKYIREILNEKLLLREKSKDLYSRLQNQSKGVKSHLKNSLIQYSEIETSRNVQNKLNLRPIDQLHNKKILNYQVKRPTFVNKY